MKTLSKQHKNTQFPLFVEKDEDGFYIVECPVLEGCYSQGKTLDEALKNIRQVIQMILKEKKSQSILRFYHPQEMSLHTITL
jgi:predicted RNase H-like HicB family nuclease